MTWLTLLACTGTPTVLLDGTLFDGPGDGASPLAGGRVSLLSPDDGSLLAEATADSSGAFSLEVEAGINTAVRVEADDLVSATFTGTIGYEETQRVEDHALYALSPDTVDALSAAFAGCGAGEGVGLAFGEVRIYEISDPVTGEHPSVASGQITVVTEGGDEVPACYWNAEGSAWDPDAVTTGEAGAFVVPALPAGTHSLEIRFDLGPGITETQVYPLYIDGAGSVSPWYPAWVSMPL